MRPNADNLPTHIDDPMLPGIWISGVSDGLSFENLIIKYRGVAVRLGVATDNVSESMTALIWFRSLQIDINSETNVSPGLHLDRRLILDLATGWFEHCVILAYRNVVLYYDTVSGRK